jgi:hypothetical protein
MDPTIWLNGIRPHPKYIVALSNNALGGFFGLGINTTISMSMNP